MRRSVRESPSLHSAALCYPFVLPFAPKAQELKPAILTKPKKQTEVCNCGSQAETHLLV